MYTSNFIVHSGSEYKYHVCARHRGILLLMTYTYVKEHNISHILNLTNPRNVPIYPGQYMPRKLCYPGKKADLNYLCKEGISIIIWGCQQRTICTISTAWECLNLILMLLLNNSLVYIMVRKILSKFLSETYCSAIKLHANCPLKSLCCFVPNHWSWTTLP